MVIGVICPVLLQGTPQETTMFAKEHIKNAYDIDTNYICSLKSPFMKLHHLYEILQILFHLFLSTKAQYFSQQWCLNVDEIKKCAWGFDSIQWYINVFWVRKPKKWNVLMRAFRGRRGRRRPPSELGTSRFVVQESPGQQFH